MVPRTLDYPTTSLNPTKNAPYDHNACLPRQTDVGRTSWQ